MEQNNDIQTYREAILQAVLNRRDPKEGLPLITEKEARSLLAQLSDDELADGMLFNTPEDVADIILED